MMKHINFILVSVLISVFLLSSVGFADGIKDRMKARKPAIKALKTAGVVGENNLGYLEFVNNKKEKENVVNAENQDRKKVYAAIAQKQGVSAEDVGRRRALQISEIADKGEWLQNKAGKWYQK